MSTPSDWDRPPSGGAGWPPSNPPPGAPPPGMGPPPGYTALPGSGGAYGIRREHPDGTTVLVLGILSLVVCGLLGPFAWVKGNAALRDIDADPMSYSNRGTVNAGRICGIVASVMLIIAAAGTVLVILLAAVAST